MKKIGELGERVVALWIQSQGYQLLNRGWSCRWGEIDLIALHKSTESLIFIEVKTRSQKNWDENGLLAVDARKQHKIYQTAKLFLAKNPQLSELYCRFDVALVSYKYSYNSEIIKTNSVNASQPIFHLEGYQLILQNYLKSAFDFS